MSHKGNRLRGLVPRSYAEAARLLDDKHAGAFAINKTTAVVRQGADSIALRHEDADVVKWWPDGRIQISTGYRAHQTRLSRIDAALPPGYALVRTIRGGCEFALMHGAQVVGTFTGRLIFTAELDRSPPADPLVPRSPPRPEAA